MRTNGSMNDAGLGDSFDSFREVIGTPASETNLVKSVNDTARQVRAQQDVFGESNDPIIKAARALRTLEGLSPVFAVGSRVCHLPTGVVGVVKSCQGAATVVEYSEGDCAVHLSVALKAVS